MVERSVVELKSVQSDLMSMQYEVKSHQIKKEEECRPCAEKGGSFRWRLGYPRGDQITDPITPKPKAQFAPILSCIHEILQSRHRKVEDCGDLSKAKHYRAWIYFPPLLPRMKLLNSVMR